MKLNGFVGTGSGKLGSSVFSTVAGEQIVRQYQPTVANPSTVAQVNQRARLKLASQLAAAIAPVIAIPRDGMKTKRNLFIKKNFENISADSGVAQVSYENIQLTNGNAGMPGISISRSQDAGITVRLMTAAEGSVSRVVYILYRKTDEEQLQYVGSKVVTNAGDEGTFPTSFDFVAGELVFWAYGMKDLNATARAKYGDYAARTGEDIAQLVMNRSLSASDYQFTGTRGATLFGNDSENVVAGANQSMVYITAAGNGSVAGEGFVNGRRAVDNGTAITVTATAASGNVFRGWRLNGTSSYVSTAASYQFTVERLTDLVAVFEENDSEAPAPGGGGE